MNYNLLIGVLLLLIVLAIDVLKYQEALSMQMDRPKIVSISFQNYQILFDTANNVPIRSILHTWSTLPLAPKMLKNSKFSKIRVNDLRGAHFARLTSQISGGVETGNIVNLVPLLHNVEKWRDFENYTDTYHYGKSIITYPLYNGKHIMTRRGKLFIPHKICKIIDYKSYCMIVGFDHGGKWCDLINPHIPC